MKKSYFNRCRHLAGQPVQAGIFLFGVLNAPVLKSLLALLLAIGVLAPASAQNSLVNTGNSPHARLRGLNLDAVHWTTGFWAERFAVCRDATLPHLWNVYTSKDSCFSFENFRIAAGLDTGSFRGPSFHDGDFYKILEAMAAMYAVTKDPVLDAQLDDAIAVIGKAQRSDGYIYTKAIIEQRKSGKAKMFDDRLSFEAYNFGHLMTAACVHYRATGKTSLLSIAKKATDFLVDFYGKASPEQARNAICPAHYMGIAEMYRTTGDKKYLELVKKLIDIRGTVEGTDDNSDREPFREMNQVNGHAVRANYLFAGAADLYAETGDTSLLGTLYRLWDDVVNRKMYITGGCGALYDGVSAEGVSYNPDTVQKIHQAYGRDFQLPNLTAHNETCASIGNLLWNWRLLQVTGNAKYADIAELELYNGILSGISLNGTRFFYTNPLAATAAYPYHLRWQDGRQPYIPLSDCCPPNVARTLAEISSYVYSLGADGLFIHLYGGNTMSEKLDDGSMLELEQQTNYPWSGAISINLKKAPLRQWGIHLRIPGWCNRFSVTVNGKKIMVNPDSNGYIGLTKSWKPGDRIQLVLEMPPVLLESNPLVEETRNQVAVKRGPVVYCLESADLPKQEIAAVIIPSSIKLAPVPARIGNANMMALAGTAGLLQEKSWQNNLYRPVNTAVKPVRIKLIPYYAWANRGASDMTVWMPVIR